MFYHVKDLQFNARVSRPDPRFARIIAGGIRWCQWRTYFSHAIFCTGFQLS